MSRLVFQSLAGLVFLELLIAVALFLPAWTVHYWQGWAFLGVFFVGVLAVTLWLMRYSPRLLQRRVQAGPIAEPTAFQRVVQSFASLAWLGLFVLSGTDHRLGWSCVPVPGVVLGLALVLMGLGLVLWVFRENEFTSATVAVAVEQKVVSTGPYALVRHPMYSGALVLLLGVPLALGSWWAELSNVVMVMVLVVRLSDEERLLLRELDGYTGYRARVRYRLVPFLY